LHPVTRMVCVTISIAVVLASTGTASAAVYAGATRQAAPIAITVAKGGQVKTIAIEWRAKCGQGSYPFGAVLTAAAKRPSFIPQGTNPLLGSVKRGRLNATSLGAESLGSIGSAAISQKITAKFKPKSASGTWSAHVDILDPEGNKLDTCDTGTFRWVALHGPNAYGGSTTQGEPVVVLTDKDRSKVIYFGIGWHASCTPDDYVQFAEDFGNFPLTGSGVFGETWTMDYPFDDRSGKSSFTYTVSGSLKKGAGSGTFSAKTVQTDTAGATTETCDTNVVRWSVSG
jgi:hypothetical protein